MPLPFNIGNPFTGVRTPAQPNQSNASTSREASTPAEQLQQYKAQAIQDAMAAAKQDNGRLPTMSDYYLAAEKIGEANKAQMAKQGISWGPEVYSDVRGLTFDGFLIRKQEIEPTPDIQRFAVAQAYKNTNGAEPTRADLIEATRQINDKLDSEGKLPPKEQDALVKIEDMYDLDGNHQITSKAISSYYSEVSNQTNFEGTEFKNVTFHPAGTLTQFHTEGASFDNVTFDGMTDQLDARGEKDHVVLGSGNYSNIHFTNIKGGTIEIANGAQVARMNIEKGSHAELIIGRASVTDLNATETHILTFKASPGAEITRAYFDGATIDMASNLKETTFKLVSFKDANLVHVDMQGATLQGVKFDNSTLTDLDLSEAKLNGVEFSGTDLNKVNVAGAKIQNMKINGTVIESAAQLEKYGIQTDKNTSISVDPEFAKQAKMEKAISDALTIGKQMAASFSLDSSQESQAVASNDQQKTSENSRSTDQGAKKGGVVDMGYYARMSARNKA